MQKLQGKIIWLTGASSGIGEALAYELSRKGAYLILSARRKEELERVKANCPGNQDHIVILPLDLSDSFAVPQKAKEAETFFGPVDILINNGGISQRAMAVDTDMEVDRKVMEVNYFGAIALSKALLPGMIARKSGHHVVVTSAVGIISTPWRSGYAASKHALHGFYDALRTEVHDYNIKITLILPGFINTPITLKALTGDGSALNVMDEVTAKGMSAEKCARLIVKAIEKQKEEVYVSGPKEKFAIYMKRFWPGMYSRLIRKAKVR
jgi:short-subunit dehydrogenase